MENDHLFVSMKYKARGDGSLQGRPRVFFCCAAADFKRLFEPVTEEILSIRRNAVIWYVDPEESTMEGKAFLEDLSQVQLLVVPVTTAFLRQDKPDSARTVAFAYAVENGIPVLPLMQEPGLEQIFNEVCGNLMVLDKTAQQQDPTAAPYEEKLRRFLEGLLVSDELTKRVKDAFDAFIFLSYRKKDRVSAQKIMRLVHENDFCRDVAIWYDEFLKPGEDFNEAIFEMIEKSALYTLVVTERLLEMPNYVQSTEYQEALKQSKPILPLEDRETAREKLKILYDKLPECLKTEDHAKIAETLHEILRSAKDVTLRENNTPEHTFLIGLAYLSGLFVEVDHDRGVKLITEAAEAGLPEALEKLVTMYQTGEGVARDYHTAIRWEEKLVQYYRKQSEADPTENHLLNYYHSLEKLGEDLTNIDDLQWAESVYYDSLKCAEKMVEKGHAKGDRNYYSSLFDLGNINMRQGRFEDAKKWYYESLAFAEAIEALTQTAEIQEDLCEIYVGIGEVYRELSCPEETKKWYQKSLEIAEKLFASSKSDTAYNLLCFTYYHLAFIHRSSGYTDEAMDYSKKFTTLAEEKYEETGTENALHIVSVSYINMGDTCASEVFWPEKAFEWYQKGISIIENQTTELMTISLRRELAHCYRKVGDLYQDLQFQDKSKAEQWYLKSLSISQEISKESETIDSMITLASVYEKLGAFCSDLKRGEEAVAWFRKSIQVQEKVAVRTETFKEKDELAVICLRLFVCINFCISGDRRRELLEWFVQENERLLRLTAYERFQQNVDDVKKIIEEENTPPNKTD